MAGGGGGELVGVTWDLNDLMALPAACCVPLRAHHSLLHGASSVSVSMAAGGASAALPPALLGVEDVPSLVPVLLRQVRSRVRILLGTQDRCLCQCVPALSCVRDMWGVRRVSLRRCECVHC